MNSKDYRRKLLQIIDTARLAPSVHNTQPWVITLGRQTITITQKKERMLTFGDGAHRQLWVSLGVFAEFCAITARQLGLESLTTIGKESITLTFSESQSTDIDKALYNSILSRFTDRSVYKKVPDIQQRLYGLEAYSAAKSINIYISTDEKIISRVAELTSIIIAVSLGNEDFRTELSEYITGPFSKKQTGIQVGDLELNLIKQLMAKYLIRSGKTKDFDSKAEKERWLSASALIFVTADGDTQQYWIDAGRSYARICLAITSLGLSQATTAGIVEAFDFHNDIESMLNTKKRILAIIRVGTGKKLRRTHLRLETDKLFA